MEREGRMTKRGSEEGKEGMGKREGKGKGENVWSSRHGLATLIPGVKRGHHLI